MSAVNTEFFNNTYKHLLIQLNVGKKLGFFEIIFGLKCDYVYLGEVTGEISQAGTEPWQRHGYDKTGRIEE